MKMKTEIMTVKYNKVKSLGIKDSFHPIPTSRTASGGEMLRRFPPEKRSDAAKQKMALLSKGMAEGVNRNTTFSSVVKEGDYFSLLVYRSAVRYLGFISLIRLKTDY